MASATEQLKSMIVANPKIALDQGDVCFYMASAQIGKPYNKTTVTEKSGPGIGIAVPISKHFGLGLFNRKVTTEVKTEGAWQKKPCTLYMLCEKFAFSVGKDVYYIDNEEITEMSIHKDALVIGSKNYSFYMFMAGKDIKKFQQIVQLIKQVQVEGATMADFGYVPSHQEQARSDASVPARNTINSKKSQSDYSKTIFIWAFSREASAVKKRDEYPGYFFYELDIQNSKSYHEQLIKDGYFEEANSDDMLRTLKADKLKEILTSHALKASGKKDDLIKRIEDNLSIDQIASLMSKKLYVITNYGQEYLCSHDDYIKLHLHRDWGITYEEYDAAKAEKPTSSFFDVCWGIFNAKILENKGNINLDRYVYYNMYQLLECENNKNRALELLLQVFYIDVNINQMFAPDIVKSIGDHEEYYNSAYVDKLYRSKLPHMSCDAETFKAIVESIMRGDFSEDAFSDKLK